jgi:hypothetical protein
MTKEQIDTFQSVREIQMKKPKKVIPFQNYKSAKDFIDAIESGELYAELKPNKDNPPPKIYPVK